MARDPVGFELTLLTVLLERSRDAYAITIADRVAERTGKTPNLGAVYKSLDRLETKGLVTSSWGEPTEARGGRRKRFYRVTASGMNAVNRVRELLAALPQPAGV